MPTTVLKRASIPVRRPKQFHRTHAVLNETSISHASVVRLWIGRPRGGPKSTNRISTVAPSEQEPYPFSSSVHADWGFERIRSTSSARRWMLTSRSTPIWGSEPDTFDELGALLDGADRCPPRRRFEADAFDELGVPGMLPRRFTPPEASASRRTASAGLHAALAAVSNGPDRAGNLSRPRRTPRPHTQYSSGVKVFVRNGIAPAGERRRPGIIGLGRSRARALSRGSRSRLRWSLALPEPIRRRHPRRCGRPRYGRLERPADVPPQRGCSCSSISHHKGHGPAVTPNSEEAAVPPPGRYFTLIW